MRGPVHGGEVQGDAPVETDGAVSLVGATCHPDQREQPAGGLHIGFKHRSTAPTWPAQPVRHRPPAGAVHEIPEAVVAFRHRRRAGAGAADSPEHDPQPDRRAHRLPRTGRQARGAQQRRRAAAGRAAARAALCRCARAGVDRCHRPGAHAAGAQRRHAAAGAAVAAGRRPAAAADAQGRAVRCADLRLGRAAVGAVLHRAAAGAGRGGASLWHALLVLGLRDVRGLQGAPSLRVDGAALRLQPGTRAFNAPRPASARSCRRWWMGACRDAA